MVSLKFDACHICDKVRFNPHTNELVGFTHDAFDENVLLRDLRDLNCEAEVKSPKSNDFSTKKAKQYILFMVSRWEQKDKPIKRVIARYAVGAGISSAFLLSEIPKIIVALFRYNLIVNNVTGDGASENRSAFKGLATISIDEMFALCGICLSISRKKSFPVSFKIAFRHPLRPDIIILIGGDMPHLLKKIVNALERSGVKKSTDLHFRGQKLSLKMLQDVWLDGNDMVSIGSLRTNKLTADHFPPKNSYSRMRVHLAVQVVSNTMVSMIGTYCKDNEERKQFYEPIKKICTTLDRLVDICNNTSMSSNGVWKGCEPINSPDHRHIGELLDILDIFCEWRNESPEKIHFIPWQSFEDLVYLIIGIIGVSKLYLKKDKSRILVQRRSGSDDVEHEFAGIRVRNPKPTALDVREISARRTGSRASTFNALCKANTSSDKDIFVDEVAAKLYRK